MAIEEDGETGNVKASRRVTQGDVAESCGVSPMTVSLALRGHSSIPKTTQERIQAEAIRMGYRRDPALQALVAHRIGLEKPAFQGTIIWLTAWKKPDEWALNRTYKAFYEGIIKRAVELGYRLESVWLGDFKWSEANCERTLRARGIEAIIFAPIPEGINLKPFSDDFFMVRVGHSLHDPGIPAVVSDLRATIEMAFSKARERGHQRIGFADGLTDHARLLGRRTAQFLYENSRLPEEERVPPLALKPGDHKSLIEYVRRERVDLLISIWPDCHRWLSDAGMKIPEDIDYIQLGEHGLKGVGVVAEAAVEVGVHTINLLDQRLRFNLRGRFYPPFRITIEPHWVTS